MRRRNWAALQRKLVDATDMTFSFDSVAYAIAQQNSAFFGSGVLTTTKYPLPFPVAIDSNDLNGTVGNGIGIDASGYQVQESDGLGAFTVTPNSGSSARWDLLVVSYLPKGQTQIPEPSQPTTNIFLNIYDYYQIQVIAGTGAAYPAKTSANQIILAGIQVPGGTTQGSQVSIDLSIREIATALRAFFPSFVQETPAGTIDGNNQTFTLSQTPYNAQSLLVSLNGLALRTSEYSLSGQTITFQTAPQPGQDVYAFYVVNGANNSTNPVSALQETPSGTVDGNNSVFSLTGQPVSQASTQVYVDGVIVPAVGWNLSQNPSGTKIYFTAGYVPQPGQEVYAFYLQNAVAQAAATTSSSSGGASANINTEYKQLQGADVTNGYVTLAHAPKNPNCVLLDVIGGGAQIYGIDFTVSGVQLTWISSDLTANLAAGDVLRINYAY